MEYHVEEKLMVFIAYNFSTMIHDRILRKMIYLPLLIQTSGNYNNKVIIIIVTL